MYSLTFLSLYCTSTVLSSLGFFSLWLSPLLLFFVCGSLLSCFSFLFGSLLFRSFLWLFALLLFFLYGLLLSHFFFSMTHCLKGKLSSLAFLFSMTLFTREATPLSSLDFLFSMTHYLQGKLHLYPLLPFSSLWLTIYKGSSTFLLSCFFLSMAK